MTHLLSFALYTRRAEVSESGLPERSEMRISSSMPKPSIARQLFQTPTSFCTPWILAASEVALGVTVNSHWPTRKSNCDASLAGVSAGRALPPPVCWAAEADENEREARAAAANASFMMGSL